MTAIKVVQARRVNPDVLAFTGAISTAVQDDGKHGYINAVIVVNYERAGAVTTGD